MYEHQATSGRGEVIVRSSWLTERGMVADDDGSGGERHGGVGLV